MVSLSREAPSATPPALGPMRYADADVAPLAALLADPGRVAMLWAVSDGRALPAGELAHAARVAPSAASAHLAKLVAGGLLVAERHGRHRYYRLASPRLVGALEALAALAPPRAARSAAEAHGGSTVRFARTCYDHLAGELGVRVTEALVEQGALALEGDTFAVTARAPEMFGVLGVDLDAVAASSRRTKRPLTRACLDWSERRYHLAGALGAALAHSLLARAWVARAPVGRALRVSNVGRRGLRRTLGLVVDVARR